MKLISCYIESFGKIKAQSFSFDGGLNKIVGDNGIGKTTLSVFIKVMLYGMSESKKTNLEENERRHYLPWDGSVASGSLEFSVGNKCYRVERSFTAKPAEDTFSLYDLATGKLSQDYTEALGKEIFGIDADGFERTVFLSERNLEGAGRNQSVSAKLGGLVGCDGDIEGLDDAVKALDEERKRFSKKGGGGEISDLKSSISDINLQLSDLDATELKLNAIEENIKGLKKQLSDNNSLQKELEKQKECVIIRKAAEKEEARISELKKSESALKDSISSFDTRFPYGLPSYELINEMSFKYREATRLLESGDEKNPQLEILKKKFEKIDDSEVKGAEDAVQRIETGRKKKERSDVREFSSAFKNRIPDSREIDSIILSGKAANKPSASGFGIGALATLLGIVLAFFLLPLLALSLIGTIILIISAVKYQAYKKKDAAYLSLTESFFISIGGECPKKEEIQDRLYCLKELLSRKEELYVPDEADDLYLIYGFLDRLPPPHLFDPIEETKAVIKEYRDYSSLLVFFRYNSGESEAKKERAAEMLSSVKAFTDKYGVNGENSFEDLRTLRLEYEKISRDLESLRKEIIRSESTEVKRETDSPRLSEEEINANRQRVDDRISELGREIALMERNADSLRLRLEDRDELLSRREDYTQRLQKSEEKLKIIRLTKELLEAAKDSMTAKYLGKTKESFEKYTGLICGDTDGRYEMNTAFEVSKLEGGRAKSSDSYSKGTRELFGLSARFALIDSLYENEYPPIILDDPFASFDDKKAHTAIALLEKLSKNRQIIYFTCSKSRS